MLDEIVGGLLGGSVGAKLRAWYIRWVEEAAMGGGDVRVRVRAHPVAAPDWRYWRGALVRRNGTIRWQPWIRRWRSFDLSGVVVVRTRITRSAADGDRALLDLHPVRRCDHLAVAIDSVRIAEAMIRPAHDPQP